MNGWVAADTEDQRRTRGVQKVIFKDYLTLSTKTISYFFYTLFILFGFIFWGEEELEASGSETEGYVGPSLR